MPPGCVQSAFWRCEGSVIGRSAAPSSLTPFSFCMTEMRLPGSGTSLSENGLLSSLGRLGKLMPTNTVGAGGKQQAR